MKQESYDFSRERFKGKQKIKMRKKRGMEIMTNEGTPVTGVEVKSLLLKAVGGVYISRGFNKILTDYYEKYLITEKELEIKENNTIILTIPIDETKQYINYAVGGEDLEIGAEWEDSTYFSYKFYIGGYMVCFNRREKETTLTWAQFQELIDNRDDAIFEVKSKKACAFYVAVDNCTIDVNNREIEINSNQVNVIIDRDIIGTIYNDSSSAMGICYRLRFNNGMSEIVISIETGQRVAIF